LQILFPALTIRRATASLAGLWVAECLIVLADVAQQDAFVEFPSHPDVHIDARFEYIFTSFDFVSSQRWMFRIIGQKIKLLFQRFFCIDRQTVNAVKKEVRIRCIAIRAT
jgi:hypothetical protein